MDIQDVLGMFRATFIIDPFANVDLMLLKYTIYIIFKWVAFNLYDFLYSVEHLRRNSKDWSLFSLPLQ